MGLLNSDHEYIDAINEVSLWGSGTCLRRLFVSMLTTNTISRPDHVWNQTWMLLAEDILISQQHIAGDTGEFLH